MPDLGAVGVLHGHVAGARAVVADQDGAEADGHPVAAQAGHPVGDLGPDLAASSSPSRSVAVMAVPLARCAGTARPWHSVIGSALSAGSGARRRP